MRLSGAVQLNAMCGQLSEAQEEARNEAEAKMRAIKQLRHADRLRTVGRLASGMAHELGTPLNVVSGRAELIAAGKLSSSEVVESANAIKAQAEQMTSIIRKLLDFARRSPPQQTSVDLRQAVRQGVELLSTIARNQNCKLHVEAGADPLPAMVDIRGE